MDDPGIESFQHPPAGAGPEAPSAHDPVSWLQIEQGWNVVTADGDVIGTVAQVAGDKQSDIFDGLAVEKGRGTPVGYVPGEQVAAIYPGKVTLKITAAEGGALAPYTEAAAQTQLRPGPQSLASRISGLFRKR